MHAEDWGGFPAETGATWLHDSNHILRKALPKGGVCQDYNRDSQGQLFPVQALIEYYVGHRLLKNLEKDVRTILQTYFEDTHTLCWEELVDKLADNTCSLPYICAIRKVFEKKQYIMLPAKPLTPEGAIKFKELLCSLETDVKNESVLGSDNYLGTGDTYFLPAGGLSQIINHLLHEVEKRPSISLRTAITVDEVQPNRETEPPLKQQVTCHHEDGHEEIFLCDKVVFAIAPHQYKSIKVSDTENARTAHALELLQPSNIAKIIIQLNQSVYLPSPVTLDYSHTLPHSIMENGHVMVTSQGTSAKDKSPILYVLCDPALVPHLTLPARMEELVKLTCPQMTTVSIVRTQAFHIDGNSWFKQQKGFRPVDNHYQDVIYLGPLTGCCDAVHSNCTRACIELGENPEIYLSKLFSLSRTWHLNPFSLFTKNLSTQPPTKPNTQNKPE